MGVAPPALLWALACALGLLAGALLWRQRAKAERAARRADGLRRFSETLRDSDEPLAHGDTLRQLLAAQTGFAVTLLLLKDALPAADEMPAALLLGTAAADPLAGLWLALRESHAFGPGTGRHEQQGDWYMPLRGRHGSRGAAWLALPALPREATALRLHAQALCDQLGLALERAQTARAAAQAREQAQAQQLRNTLLAAISHDYRTPLATILSAATALQEQAERLSIEQRRRLATSIAAEADQLSRLTDNTLQLARLDAPGLALRRDWESAEELVGAVLRRLRPRDPGRRVRSRLEPGLPLLHCDAVLLVQLLDNLLDNALKHGGEETPVEILVRRLGEQVVIAVRDRGPGVPPAWRERVFEVFQRGQSAGGRGVGVGLAVCRAIARAHGGELVYRPRGHGGASFECRLPVVEPPQAPQAPAP